MWNIIIFFFFCTRANFIILKGDTIAQRAVLQKYKFEPKVSFNNVHKIRQRVRYIYCGRVN